MENRRSQEMREEAGNVQESGEEAAEAVVVELTTEAVVMGETTDAVTAEVTEDANEASDASATEGAEGTTVSVSFPFTPQRLEFQCIVCDDWGVWREFGAAPCGCVLHATCLARWLMTEDKITCPRCREEVKPQAVRPIQLPERRVGHGDEDRSPEAQAAFTSLREGRRPRYAQAVYESDEEEELPTGDVVEDADDWYGPWTPLRREDHYITPEGYIGIPAGAENDPDVVGWRPREIIYPPPSLPPPPPRYTMNNPPPQTESDPTLNAIAGSEEFRTAVVQELQAHGDILAVWCRMYAEEEVDRARIAWANSIIALHAHVLDLRRSRAQLFELLCRVSREWTDLTNDLMQLLFSVDAEAIARVLRANDRSNLGARTSDSLVNQYRNFAASQRVIRPLLLGVRNLEATRDDAGDRRPARVAEVAANIGEEARDIDEAVERRTEMVSRYSVVSDELLTRGEVQMRDERPGASMDFVPAVLRGDFNDVNAERRARDIVNRLERALVRRRQLANAARQRENIARDEAEQEQATRPAATAAAEGAAGAVERERETASTPEAAPRRRRRGRARGRGEWMRQQQERQRQLREEVLQRLQHPSNPAGEEQRQQQARAIGQGQQQERATPRSNDTRQQHEQPATSEQQQHRQQALNSPAARSVETGESGEVGNEEREVMRLITQGMAEIRLQRERQEWARGQQGAGGSVTQKACERRARVRDDGRRSALAGDIDAAELDRDELIGSGGGLDEPLGTRPETPPPELEEMVEEGAESEAAPEPEPPAEASGACARSISPPPEMQTEWRISAEERRRLAIADIAAGLEAERRAEIVAHDILGTTAASAPWGLPFNHANRPFVGYTEQIVASFHERRCRIRNVTREVVRQLAPVRRLGDVERDVENDELDMSRQEDEAVADNAAAAANEAWNRCAEEAVREFRLQVEDFSMESTTVPDDYTFFDLMDAEHVVDHRRRMVNQAEGGGLEAARMAAQYWFEISRRRDVPTPEAAAAAARGGRGESEDERRRREDEEEGMLRAVRQHLEGDTLPQHLRPRDPRSRRAERDIHDDFRMVLRGPPEDETDL